MTRHNQNPDHDYVGLRASIERYLEDHSGDDAVRAVADGLEDVYREEFEEEYNVEKTALTACIGRLIEGWTQCKHGWGSPRDPPSDHPPCKPPHCDHGALWTRDSEPVAFTMHLYDVGRDVVEDVVSFADTHDLLVSVEAGSWYFPGRTTLIVFYAPKRLRASPEEERD